MGDLDRDLRTRALVVGHLAVASAHGAAQLRGLGADLVEVDGITADDVAAVVPAMGVPVAVRSPVPEVLSAAARAGAVAIISAEGVSASGARARTSAWRCMIRTIDEVVAGGVPLSRLAVDAGGDLAASVAALQDVLQTVTDLAELGMIRCFGSPRGERIDMVLGTTGVRPAARHALGTLAIARGARLLRTEDVKGARRVADVVGAVLASREAARA